MVQSADLFTQKCQRSTIISGFVLLITVALAQHPDLVDRPASRWISEQVGRSAIADRVFFAFDTYFTFSGAALMALIWAYWSAGGAQRRARLAVGVPVAFGAGILSRALQHGLSSHLRPLYDPAVAFHVPGGFAVSPLNMWNSFPSDHVAVFAGLAVVLFTVGSRLAIPAASWAALVGSSRLYMGAHFVSDLIGGAALAATCVWAAQGRALVRLGARVVALERSAAPVFHALAFLIATLFVEIRGLTGGFSLLHSLR